MYFERGQDSIPDYGQAAKIIQKVTDFLSIISIDSNAGGPRLAAMFSRRKVDKQKKAWK